MVIQESCITIVMINRGNYFFTIICKNKELELFVPVPLKNFLLYLGQLLLSMRLTFLPVRGGLDVERLVLVP